MAPVKFDDLAKTATEVLNDDYQTSGFQTKAKQKTSWDGAVATTTVDLWPAEGQVQTPAKISWKLPKPFGCTAIMVDKFEMDKAGKFKLEISADKALHKVADLKVEAKHDLANLSKATVACVYTGLKDTQIKIETAPLALQNTSLEVTRAIDKARDDLKVAGSYEQGGKSSGSFGVGVAYSLNSKASLKAKLQQDGSLLGSLKYDLSKGFTILAGGKFNVNGGSSSYGLQLSIE